MKWKQKKRNTVFTLSITDFRPTFNGKSRISTIAFRPTNQGRNKNKMRAQYLRELSWKRSVVQRQCISPAVFRIAKSFKIKESNKSFFVFFLFYFVLFLFFCCCFFLFVFFHVPWKECNLPVVAQSCCCFVFWDRLVDLVIWQSA